MNTKRIARLYLHWFAQEAMDLHVRLPAEEAIIWSADGSFAIAYHHADGFRSYQQFVRDLAGARLTEEQARRVLLDAVGLVVASMKQPG